MTQVSDLGSRGDDAGEKKAAHIRTRNPISKLPFGHVLSPFTQYGGSSGCWTKGDVLKDEARHCCGKTSRTSSSKFKR